MVGINSFRGEEASCLLALLVMGLTFLIENSWFEKASNLLNLLGIEACLFGRVMAQNRPGLLETANVPGPVCIAFDRWPGRLISRCSRIADAGGFLAGPGCMIYLSR